MLQKQIDKGNKVIPNKMKKFSSFLRPEIIKMRNVTANMNQMEVHISNY